MHYIDLIIGLLLLFAAIKGFKNGFISELTSLAALVLGIWGAIEFSGVTSDFLTDKFRLQTEYLNIISFVVTFIAVVILVHITGNSINKLIEVVMLGFLNRLSGLLFAIIRSALIISIILLVFDKIDADMKILSQKAKSESRLYESVRNLAPSIFPFVRLWDENGRLKEEPGNIIRKIKVSCHS